MRICINPGFVADLNFTLRDRAGNDAPWPDGTTTRMRFSWGTGTEFVKDGTVDGALLSFTLTAADTEQFPRGTVATVDVNYDAGDPDMWRPWLTGRLGC